MAQFIREKIDRQVERSLVHSPLPELYIYTESTPELGMLLSRKLTSSLERKVGGVTIVKTEKL